MSVPLTTPYVGPIPGGLLPGKMIFVQGHVPPVSTWFAINLQVGPSVNPRADLALHISVRIPEHMVVRNSLQAQQWGVEERHGGMPAGIMPNSTFEAIILVQPDCYKIAFNGQHFTEFVHRIPINYVNTINIEGDVVLTGLKFEGAGMAPTVLGSTQMPRGNVMGVPGPVPVPAMGQPGYGLPHSHGVHSGHSKAYPAMGVVPGMYGDHHGHVKHGKHGKVKMKKMGKEHKKMKKMGKVGKVKKKKHHKGSSSSSSSSSSSDE